MASPSPTAADPTDAYESRSVSVTENGKPVEFRFRLLRPPVGGPATKYPVVLFLHGAGERGSDNTKQLNYLPTWMAEPGLRQQHPCFVVAPQCRENHKWVDIDWSESKSSRQTAEPSADLAAAVAALDSVLKSEPVDPNRIYLTGLSMGGYGTWDLAARMPDRFAALLPICGGGDETTAPRIAQLPIWCFHGDADNAVPVERSRQMIAAVKAAGGKPRYSELQGVGHDSWTPAYRDPAVLEWLFDQSR
ncbi:MAG: PHB depolymerase family esterase [Pirellulales bacterium]